jgi:hypothetical protein
MSYPRLSILVAIPTRGSAHSLRKLMPFKLPCALQFPYFVCVCVCVCFFNLDVVALLPPLHVASLSLPSQYSWTAGSQNQDLVNSFIPPTQVLN